MTVTLIRQAWASCRGSLLRIALTGYLLLSTLIVQVVGHDPGLGARTIASAFLPLMVASLWPDRRQGLLRSILGRPVERWRIVACRYAGIVSLSWALGAVTLLVSHGLAAATGADDFRVGSLAVQWAELLLHLMPAAAWFVGLSAVLPWGSEAAPLVVAVLVQDVMEGSAEQYGEAAVFLANLPTGLVSIGDAHGLAALISATSSSAVLLSLSILLFNWAPLPGEVRS